MWRRFVLPGFLGGLVMSIWGVVINGLLGFKARIDMKPIPDEPRVYAVLKESIVEPGRYACNPALTDGGAFPGGEPAFSILYGGVGHEAAGWLLLVQLPLFFALPTLAAGMLSRAGDRVLSSYPRKAAFFAAIGLLVGASSHLMSFGIGGYPIDSALALALHDAAAWTVAGLVMAWRIRPPTA